MTSTPPGEPTLQSERVYSGRVVGLRVDTVRLPDGREAKREIVEHDPSVVVVPVDEQGQVLLVRQYRKATENALLEAPAGGMDPGESPEEAAVRELREEVGMTAGDVRPLAGFWLSPGFCTEFMYAYLATRLERAPLPPDADEDIQVEPVTVDEAVSMVRDGRIQDAKSVAAILLARDVLRERG